MKQKTQSNSFYTKHTFKKTNVTSNFIIKNFLNLINLIIQLIVLIDKTHIPLIV